MRRLTQRSKQRITKRLIGLTIITICAIIIFVGCKNGKKTLGNETEVVKNIEVDSNEIEPTKKEEIENEIYQYNESGKIMIVMFHKFAEEEKDEWTRSFENFYKDLEYLYERGYRTISLSDYVNRDIKVPEGCTPIIFTFDDGSRSQFNLIEDENGNLIANPDSAVGIMEKFYAKYPDFGLNGTFYINNTGYFGNVGTRKEKLEYLINKGFEIGNHTSNHMNLTKASAGDLQKEIGENVNAVKELLNGYELVSLALPNGSIPKENKEYLVSGEYQGTKYTNKTIMLVGANPALSPNHENVNFSRLPRVRATGGNKRVDCDLYYWLDKMDENPELKYYRIKN